MITKHILDSEEKWLKFREDIFTSSEVIRLLSEPTKAQVKAGELLSDGAVSYIFEKLAGQFGSSKPIYFNAEMQYGKDTEPTAALRLCEDFKYDPKAKDVNYGNADGIIIYSNGKLGGTPDMILPKSIVEIKCPNSDTHLRYKTYDAKKFKEKLPKYYSQIQSNMYLAEVENAIFMSFDDRFKDRNRQAHYIIIDRDEPFINQTLEKVDIAFDYMQELKTKL
jgi:hypothetical protein